MRALLLAAVLFAFPARAETLAPIPPLPPATEQGARQTWEINLRAWCMRFTASHVLRYGPPNMLQLLTDARTCYDFVYVSANPAGTMPPPSSGQLPTPPPP